MRHEECIGFRADGRSYLLATRRWRFFFREQLVHHIDVNGAEAHFILSRTLDDTALEQLRRWMEVHGRVIPDALTSKAEAIRWTRQDLDRGYFGFLTLMATPATNVSIQRALATYADQTVSGHAGTTQTSNREPPPDDKDTTIPATSTKPPSTQNCDHKVPSITPATCDYYQQRHDDFLRRHRGCAHKPPDYYLEHGKKYCLRFATELAPKLSEQGKKWLGRARVHLQQALEQELKRNPQIELNPNAFRTFAFDTHADAYWNAGLHDLTLDDKARIATTTGIIDWKRPETWDEGWKLAQREVEATADDIQSEIQQGVKEAVEKLEDLQQGAKKAVERFEDLQQGAKKAADKVEEVIDEVKGFFDKLL